MKATIRLDSTMLEEISVDNGLRQGCCMAPVLFNLYASLVHERWIERVKDAEGVGVDAVFKLDKKLFRRYTRNGTQKHLSEGQFADDTALFANTRRASHVRVCHNQ